MNASLILAFLWALAVNLTLVFSDEESRWQQIVLLIACGIPILGFVTYQNGPWWGLGMFAAGISVLRWPMITVGAWLRGFQR